MRRCRTPLLVEDDLRDQCRSQCAETHVGDRAGIDRSTLPLERRLRLVRGVVAACRVSNVARAATYTVRLCGRRRSRLVASAVDDAQKADRPCWPSG